MTPLCVPLRCPHPFPCSKIASAKCHDSSTTAPPSARIESRRQLCFLLPSFSNGKIFGGRILYRSEVLSPGNKGLEIVYKTLNVCIVYSSACAFFWG